MSNLEKVSFVIIFLVFSATFTYTQFDNFNNSNCYDSNLTSSLINNSSWICNWGNKSWDSQRIIADSLENVYSAGIIHEYPPLSSIITDYSSSSMNDYTFFFSKFNNYGLKEWILMNFTQTSFSHCLGLSVGSDSNIYSLWNVDFDDKALLLKLTSSGKMLWNKTLRINAEIFYLDRHDNIYIMGYFFDPDHPNDSFLKLVKFNTLGIMEWNNSFLMNNLVFPSSLIVDNSNYSYIAGIEPSDTYNAGYEYTPEICLWRLNSSGEIISIKEWDMSPYHVYYNMFFDDLCNLYLIATDDSLSVNKLFKYNNLGDSILNITWKSPILKKALDLWDNLAFDSSGKIYCTGSKYFYITRPYSEIYLVIFNENGTLIQSGVWKNYNFAFCNDMHIDSNNNIYLTGSYDEGPFIVKNPVLSEFSIFYFDIDEDTLFSLILLSSIFGFWGLLGICFYIYFLKKRSI